MTVKVVFPVAEGNHVTSASLCTLRKSLISLISQSQAKTCFSPALYSVSDCVVPLGEIYLGKMMKIKAASIKKGDCISHSAY